jgi:hypothetical protein
VRTRRSPVFSFQSVTLTSVRPFSGCSRHCGNHHGAHNRAAVATAKSATAPEGEYPVNNPVTTSYNSSFLAPDTDRMNESMTDDAFDEQLTTALAMTSKLQL